MPAFFVPARSSRHRAACFGLYRALLQQAAKIPLPDDVVSRAGQVNPIKHLIRKGFRRNRGDTSPRLVVAALENGYKFLNFLNQAQTTSSREYPSVLSLLRSRLERRASLLPSKPRPTTAPGPDLVPLLTRVKPSAKGRSDALIYVPTVRPRPLEDLKGRRRVPIFVTESNGFPFLRVGKPNSPVLSRVLRQKSRKRSERATLRQQLRTEEIPFVAQEDAWEAALARLADEEGQAHILGTRSSGETYRQGTKDAIRHLEGVLDAEKADMIARGRALLNLVEAERELAGREKQEREERKVHRREAWEAKMAEAKKAS